MAVAPPRPDDTSRAPFDAYEEWASEHQRMHDAVEAIADCLGEILPPGTQLGDELPAVFADFVEIIDRYADRFIEAGAAVVDALTTEDALPLVVERDLKERFDAMDDLASAFGALRDAALWAYEERFGEFPAALHDTYPTVERSAGPPDGRLPTHLEGATQYPETPAARGTAGSSPPRRRDERPATAPRPGDLRAPVVQIHTAIVEDIAHDGTLLADYGRDLLREFADCFRTHRDRQIAILRTLETLPPFDNAARGRDFNEVRRTLVAETRVHLSVFQGLASYTAHWRGPHLDDPAPLPAAPEPDEPSTSLQTGVVAARADMPAIHDETPVATATTATAAPAAGAHGADVRTMYSEFRDDWAAMRSAGARNGVHPFYRSDFPAMLDRVRELRGRPGLDEPMRNNLDGFLRTSAEFAARRGEVRSLDERLQTHMDAGTAILHEAIAGGYSDVEHPGHARWVSHAAALAAEASSLIADRDTYGVHLDAQLERKARIESTVSGLEDLLALDRERMPVPHDSLDRPKAAHRAPLAVEPPGREPTIAAGSDADIGIGF